MAVDMFLKIEGIEGESADDKHGKLIDVLAFSWGMSQSGSMHVGAGGGSGKVNVQDLSVTKYLDKSSTVLMEKCCSGKHFPKATLICRKAGDTPLEHWIIEMEEVLVSSISAGASKGEDMMTENISLNFAKFKAQYTPQNATGGAEGKVFHGWDIRKNVKV